MKTFSERLKDARSQMKLTQAQMAAILGISVRAYQHYELDAREPNYGNLVTICKTLNVSSDFLLGLSDSKNYI